MKHDEFRDCLLITLLAGVPVLLLRPFQNAPFVDDWVYAWPVEWLLKHGELKILDISASLNVFQILWGTLFCLLFGFSFTALRISTWVLSVACLCGLYLTLREFGVSRRDSLIGTAALATYPVYFVLSYTGMTDVPFLAITVWFCLSVAKAVRQRHDGWLAASAIFASLAIGVRVTGIALPFVMLLVLLFHSENWGRRNGRFLLALIPLASCGLLLWWHKGHVQYSADLSLIWNAPANRLKWLKAETLQRLPEYLSRAFVSTVMTLGVALVPLTAGCRLNAHRRRLAGVFVVLAFVLIAHMVVGFEYNPPLGDGSTWSVHELGATKPLVPGYEGYSFPMWWDRTSCVIGMFLGAMVVAPMRRRLQHGEACLIWLALGEFLLAAVLLLFYDRYVLVFVPVAIVLLLCQSPLVRPRIAVMLITVFAVVSIAGMRDHLEYSRALWAGVDYLRGHGAKDSEIVAGYVVNGWLQYAHPENAPVDEQGKITVPGVTTRMHLRYEISNSMLPNWRLLTNIQYGQWLSQPGSIYVEERTADSR